ncbi:MAG: hypothetical protein AAFV29_18130, partial [Myxococcota bacterium]
MKLHHEEPRPGAHIVTDASDIDPILLRTALDDSNQPSDKEKALEITVLWGDTVVSEAQFRKPGAIRLGNRTSRPRPDIDVDGGFPADSFTIATLANGQAQIVLPSGAKTALRSRDGRVVRQVPVSPIDGPFPSQAYALRIGERLVYKTGTVTVMAQFVRGNAVMGRGAIVDWIFPATFTICFLLHAFFIAGTFLAPDRSTDLLDDLLKNQNRFAQMILKAPEEPKKRKKLDLSGMKGGERAKNEEGKFAKRREIKKDALASKAGAPRVDPKKREKDRK